MKERHVLLDFENVQPALDELYELVPAFTDVWLFHGPHQAKQAQAFAASHERVTVVPRSGRGPNALDFHLSFYLGYVAAKHPDAELVVVANDRGYEPMLAHARMLGFRTRRVGYKVPVAKKATLVKPATPVAVPLAAKKAVVKKAVAKKAEAKQAAPKPAAPFKVAAAKKAPATKKAAAKKAVVPKPTKPGATPEAKLLDRITKGLVKMGNKAPTKLKSFLNALKPMLDENSTAADVEAMLRTLQSKGVVQVQGAVVTYPK